MLLNKKTLTQKVRVCFMAVWTGLEPATPCVTGRYSNQLNYQTNDFMLTSRQYSDNSRIQTLLNCLNKAFFIYRNFY